MTVILVTGASGFIGRHAMSALLAAGHVVHGLSRRPAETSPGEWHRVDLFDDGAVDRVLLRVRPTHLLHLGWETEHGRYWTSPQNLRWVEATLRLARRFQELGGRRFVGVGTCAEYTWDDAVLKTGPVHERRTPRQPQRFYGTAKHATFELLNAYAASVGLDFAWARLFFPYGPGGRAETLVPSVILALREGRTALCTHGRQQRDFVYVRDAGEALAALVVRDVSGPVNVASGSGTAIAEVVTKLGALLGRPELIRLGALDAPPDEPAALVADVGRLRDEVGYVPKTGLDEGLQEAVAWWTEGRRGS
jgi:nucleoside-diphosphate-sugar epimerase